MLQSNHIIVPVLPDGKGGFTPCPTLLTESETIRYLRLDCSNGGNHKNTLKYYRDKDLLKTTRVGRQLFYMREFLDEFLVNQTT